MSPGRACSERSRRQQISSASGGRPVKCRGRPAEELLKKSKSDLWDSGLVVGGQSVQVEYAGKAFESRMQCDWKFKLYRTAGASWRQPAFWTMGLLEPEDWQAKWIKPDSDHTSPLVRKEFTLGAVHERAIVSV